MEPRAKQRKCQLSSLHICQVNDLLDRLDKMGNLRYKEHRRGKSHAVACSRQKWDFHWSARERKCIIVYLICMSDEEWNIWQISGETASSTVNAGSLSDLADLASASLYGFEDYHGVDIGVVRAVRLWFAPLGGEIAVDIKLQEGDVKLGFAISRTEEVYILYINSFLSPWPIPLCYQLYIGQVIDLIILCHN